MKAGRGYNAALTLKLVKPSVIRENRQPTQATENLKKITMATRYTIKQLDNAKSLKEIRGRTHTGSTKDVNYKVVRLADRETYSEAILVSYFGRPFSIIQDPARRSQFLHRGC